MVQDFCTRTTKTLRKLGYEKKPSRFVAQFCYIGMTLVCGLFGFFDIFGDGIEPVRSSPAVSVRYRGSSPQMPVSGPFRQPSLFYVDDRRTGCH